jgi:Family of unknown function (DUF6424)
MTNPEPVHPESESHPWSINVPNHPTRADSPEYVAARNQMNKMAGQASGMIYGQGPYQDHHGGALWLQDSQGWFLVRNQAGIEWSAQFCLSGDARVLTADLRWIPLTDVFVGQVLLGFDEESQPRLWRRWQPSEVLAKRTIERPCYDLVFDDGTRVRASAEHRWLVGRGGSHADSEWVTTESLRADKGWTPEEDAALLALLTSGATVAEAAGKLGRPAVAVGSRKSRLSSGRAGTPRDVRSKVLRLVEVWEEDQSRGAGYLAAAFDGEGWLSQVEDEQRGRGFGTSVRLGFAQRSNAMLEEVERLLKERGVAYSLRCASDNCNRVMIRGRAEIMRLLGSVRPQRLMADFRPSMLGTMQRVGVATLVEKKFVGMQEVVAITTSTGTFVAEGLASHNCADPAKVDLLRQNAKRLYDLVSPQVKQQLDPGGLLHTPITDAAGVAKWTDSIFNAGVPLHPNFHTGVLPGGATQSQPAPADPEPGGVHHYPTPIADIQLFKYDDFQLWVTDQQGNPAAVAPVDQRGSGNASVHVLYATPGSQLAQQKHEAESAGAPLILGPDHPLSVQAYQNQQAPGSAGAADDGGARPA